ARLAEAYTRSASWGLCPEQPSSVIVDSAFRERVDHLFALAIAMQPGCFSKNHCQDGSLFMLKMLADDGIPAEVIIGDVLLENRPVWNVTVKQLKRQLKRGRDYAAGETQEVHCWLSIGGSHILDPTISWYTDGRPGYIFDHADQIDPIVEHVPLAAGWRFIHKTNRHPIAELLNENLLAR